MRKPNKKAGRGATYRPRCPECGQSAFTLFPAVMPELHIEFLDNGDVVRRLEDSQEDDRDQLTCTNCGRACTWPQCDHRRGNPPSEGKPLIDIL